MNTLLLFGATVLPIVFTPGPDILFISSQGLASGAKSALKANLGVLLGYMMHSLLAALGLAAVIVASPTIFSSLRWFGVAYILYLALKMLKSAMKKGLYSTPVEPAKTVIIKGFFTSFLNPKGLLVYFAILPNFIKPDASIFMQSLTLSSVYIGSCAIVYSIIALVFSQINKGKYSDKHRRIGEGVAGGILVTAACSLALG